MTIDLEHVTEDKIRNMILESSEAIRKSTGLATDIITVIEHITTCFKNGKKLVIFGNGGSAADAQHLAAEFIGRFQLERKSQPAIALTTDTSILTSLSNDYSFDIVFSRQCEALVSEGDVVLGISTSGNSKNVLNGLLVSKGKGAKTIALLGKNGGHIKEVTDTCIVVNSNSTPHIQEVHRVIIHIICELVEKNIAERSKI